MEGLMSIGEFAKRSRLSPKALRLYDEMGLLLPAQVDADTGYRFYGTDQVEQARLVAMLRQLQVPLTEIKAMLMLEPHDAAERLASYWTSVEAQHAFRRDLAGLLINQLNGRRVNMYEVNIREIPSRQLLCEKRHVEGWDGAWAFGKEFIARFKAHPILRLEGREGAMFCIYWGEVSEDSDGPIEWCWPVADDQAEELAAAFPQFTLRTEPAHREAYVSLGAYGDLGAEQWPLISESLRAWVLTEGAPLIDLGIRMTYLAPPAGSQPMVPDCDFAVPLR